VINLYHIACIITKQMCGISLLGRFDEDGEVNMYAEHYARGFEVGSTVTCLSRECKDDNRKSEGLGIDVVTFCYIRL
jgi:hypothetical protein